MLDHFFVHNQWLMSQIADTLGRVRYEMNGMVSRIDALQRADIQSDKKLLPSMQRWIEQSYSDASAENAANRAQADRSAADEYPNGTLRRDTRVPSCTHTGKAHSGECIYLVQPPRLGCLCAPDDRKSPRNMA